MTPLADAQPRLRLHHPAGQPRPADFFQGKEPIPTAFNVVGTLLWKHTCRVTIMTKENMMRAPPVIPGDARGYSKPLTVRIIRRRAILQYTPRRAL